MNYSLVAVSLMLVVAGSAQAASGWQSSLLLGGTDRQSDVTDAAQSQNSLSGDMRLQWSGPMAGPVGGVFDMRASVSNRNTAVQEASSGLDAAARSEHYLALRQAGLVWQPLGWTGFPGEALSAGLLRRQSENTGWWDGSIESVGWSLDTTTTQASLVVGQQFRTWRSASDLTVYDQDKTRLFGEWIQDWQPGYAWVARVMYARQSGVTEPDTIDNPQGLNGDWLWLGLGVRHGWFGRPPMSQDRLAWLLELTGLRGRADLQDSGGSRTDDARIKAWSLEGGLRYDWYLPQHLALGSHYFYGSGGSDDSQSKTFVQTGLQSNYQMFWGNRQTLFQFIDVLHADPGNLSLWSLFAVWDPLPDVETGLMWSQLYRNDRDVAVYANGAALDTIQGGSRSVGQGMDLVGAWYFHSLLAHPVDGRLRLRGSLFETGTAFVQSHEREHKLTLDVLFNF